MCSLVCNILCCIYWCINRRKESERSRLRTDGARVIPAGIPIGVQDDPNPVVDESEGERPIIRGNNSVENGHFIENV